MRVPSGDQDGVLPGPTSIRSVPSGSTVQIDCVMTPLKAVFSCRSKTIFEPSGDQLE